MGSVLSKGGEYVFLCFVELKCFLIVHVTGFILRQSPWFVAQAGLEFHLNLLCVKILGSAGTQLGLLS